ncbi:MAG TPA: cytochrome c biogenesis CcdA family protein [archaeon]|nr:cytochrome c biogenesis CcdA family protein [archaeon]
MFKKILVILILLMSVGLVLAADSNCEDENTTVCTIEPGEPLFGKLLTKDTINQTEKTEIFGLVYFTGIGCPHCAKVDPILLKKMPFENNNLAIIEYEVKLNQENAKLMVEYNNEFESGLGYPLIILSQYDSFVSGDIVPKVERSLEQGKTNDVPFPATVYEKGTTAFENIEFSKLKGKPVIWYNGKVISRFYDGETPVDDKILHEILNAKTPEEIEEVIKKYDYHTIDDKRIQLSQTEIVFDNTIHLPGWKIYYNGESTLSYVACPITTEVTEQDCAEKKKIPLLTVVSLALVDAVNPCEFAVLIMLLIAIMTAYPKNKKKTLQAGLAFTAAIFILYFIYGVLLINVFKLIPGIDSIRTVVYTIIACIAILIGLLQLKDFFDYKPGGFLTEMPMSFRPKVQKMISSITSPGGAFIVGAFVTLFLMPCTIGPYVILGNLLASETILAALPQLLLYNIIFILPMLAITFTVYFGVRKVDQVAEWKARNTKYMHLIAGIIMLLIGIGMLLGWF